jgi:energy-coupling factor transporter transmembrane protein EcfT
MQEIKKIGVWSLGKFHAVFMAIIGLITGLVFAAIGSGVAFLLGPEAEIYAKIGYWSIIIFPVLYAILGLFLGAVVASFYNFAARLVGGVKIELAGEALEVVAPARVAKKRGN